MFVDNEFLIICGCVLVDCDVLCCCDLISFMFEVLEGWECFEWYVFFVGKFGDFDSFEDVESEVIVYLNSGKVIYLRIENVMLIGLMVVDFL